MFNEFISKLDDFRRNISERSRQHVIVSENVYGASDPGQKR